MSKPVPTNKALYERIKKKVYAKNPKHSAYRSGQIVKQYKVAGGGYSGYKEDWRTEKGKKTYKEGGTIFRPTKRVSKDTPTTMKELTPAQKKKAIAEKKATGRVKKYKK